MESWLNVLVALIDTWLQLQDQDWMSATGTLKHIFLDNTVFMACVQAAVCDYRSRFRYFAVVAPGICCDQVAFERTLLPEMMQAFPVGTYCGGNAAYLVSEKMIIPITGSSQPVNPYKDAHSF